MNVTVFVPTYRRPATLVWSLLSVLAQEVASPNATLEVVVLNNDAETPSVEEAVRAARARLPEGPWRVRVVHRNPPMDPVLSWYDGIREYARPGACVFLHSDDDLMLPGSVDTRSRILLDSGADMLLSKSGHGLFFHGAHAEQALLDSAPSPGGGAHWAPLSAMEALAYGPAFIGNHTYRWGEPFWSGYMKSLERMRTIPISGTQQLAMLPFVLPIDVASSGKLVGSEFVGCIRGQSTSEIFEGHLNWKPGVLYAASLLLFTQGEWANREDLEPWRAQLRSELAEWVFATFANRSARKQLLVLLQRLRWTPTLTEGRSLAAGLSLLAKTTLGVRGLRLRRRLRLEQRPTPQLFESIFAKAVPAAS